MCAHNKLFVVYIAPSGKACCECAVNRQSWDLTFHLTAPEIDRGPLSSSGRAVGGWTQPASESVEERERERERERCWFGECKWKQCGGWQRVPGISAEPVRETLRLMGREGPQERIWTYKSFKCKVFERKLKVYVEERRLWIFCVWPLLSLASNPHAAMSQLQTIDTVCKRDSARWVVSKLLLIDLGGAQVCRRKYLKALLPSRCRVK